MSRSCSACKRCRLTVHKSCNIRYDGKDVKSKMNIELSATLAILSILAHTFPNAAGAARRRPFELDYDKLFKMDKTHVERTPKTSLRERKKLRGSSRALGTFINDLLPGAIDIIPFAKPAIAALHSVISKL